jgi:hypothetical protein
MANQPRDIRYVNRDFESLSEELENFVQVYYPDSHEDFSPESIGKIWMDLASYVGDVLSFYTDRQFQETLIQEAEERQNVISLAQSVGYMPKLSRPATTTLEVIVRAPVRNNPQTGELEPDFDVVPKIQEGMVVGSSSEGSVEFRTTREVDFSVDRFDDPLEVTISETNQNTGDPEFYLLRKTVPAVAGSVRSETFEFGSPEPYAERRIADDDFIQVLNARDSDGNVWYEVPYLAQETVFEEFKNGKFTDPNFSEDDSVDFLLTLRETPRRFVTRLDRQEQVVLRFGGGTSSEPDERIVPSPKNIGNPTLKAIDQLDQPLDPSNFLVTSTYGQVPFNTELTVQYLSGGGLESNVPKDDLTRVKSVEFNLSESSATTPTDQQLIQDVQNSLAVRNAEPATGGRGAESTREIKQNAQAFFSAQDRAVTDKDFTVRALNLPGRYGSVAKVYVTNDRVGFRDDFLENPLAVNLYVLGYDNNKRLTEVSDTVKQNLKTYLEQFRMQTDAVQVKDGFVINIAVDFEILTFSSFNRREVLVKCIDRLRELFDNDRMQFNQPLVKGEYVRELNEIQGVQNVTRFDIENKFGGDYSENVYDIQSATEGGIVYPSQDPSVFEVKFPDADITGNAR